MRLAFKMAGWDNEGDWATSEMSPPAWMIDYTVPPSLDYVEGLIPLSSPHPRSMRIIEKEIDVGEYLPHNKLMAKLKTTNSASWHGLGPTDEFLR